MNFRLDGYLGVELFNVIYTFKELFGKTVNREKKDQIIIIIICLKK